jgi:hypothetical protein
MEMNFEQLKEAVIGLDSTELTELNVAIAKEIQRRSKGMGKAKSKTGVVNAGLAEFNAFSAFVRENALKNGWSSFDMNVSKMNSSTGKKETHVEEMSGSVERDRNHVFSVGGKTFSTAHAKSLAAKLKKENDALYTEWKAEYEPSEVSEKADSPVMRVSAKEKQAAKEAADELKAENKKKREEAKAKKEAEAKAKAEARLKKLEEDMEKQKKIMENGPEKKPRASSKSPAESPKPVSESPAESPKPVSESPKVVKAVADVKTTVAAKPMVVDLDDESISKAKAVPKTKAVAKKAPKVEPFEIKDGDTCAIWKYEGKSVIRFRSGLVYEDAGVDENGETLVGDFLGVYDSKKNVLATNLSQEEAEEHYANDDE